MGDFPRAAGVIAEYVETDVQRDKLKALGCSQYQGYLYSRALSGEDLSRFIADHRERSPMGA